MDFSLCISKANAFSNFWSQLLGPNPKKYMVASSRPNMYLTTLKPLDESGIKIAMRLNI